ncbi:MAG: bifunctional precorrin-2 dehydrogenase/sirohydrochlorin ferrochelatase [Candidatus Geothermarchaeales archaeon]
MRLPLYVEANNRSILLVGGGGEATRRALKFLRAGASVRVLSKWFSPELEEAAERGKLELIRGEAKDEELLRPLVSSSDLIIIATDDEEANNLIYDMGRRLGKLINLVTDADKTDVVVPFEASVAGLRITVTSEGKSGLVVRDALDKIVDLLERDREIPILLESMHYLKRELKKVLGDARKRIRAYKAVYNDPTFRELVQNENVEKAKRYALEVALERFNPES